MDFEITFDGSKKEFYKLEVDFDQLERIVRDTFNLVNQKFRISYIDNDGDPIIVEDATDWEACFAEFVDTSVANQPLKLKITKDGPESPGFMGRSEILGDRSHDFGGD